MYQTIQPNSLRSFARLFLNACCLLVLFPVSSFAMPPQLSLEEAIAKTLKYNPQLLQFEFSKNLLQAERELSRLKPAYHASADVENFAGTGESQGFSNAEYTVALSSVIELGSKREARLAVSDARLYTHEIQRKALTLDVLGDLTINFIEALTTQEELALALEATTLAQSLYSKVKSKAENGAASDADVMRAKAGIAQAKIQSRNLQRKLARQKMNLASFWGDSDIEFDQLTGSLIAFSEAQPYSSLLEKVKSSPAMEVLATQVRVKDMEFKLAQSQSHADLSWRLGIRRLQETQDTSLVLGVSMPLFTESRNRTNTEAAVAAREQLDAQRQGYLIKLNTQLFAAYSLRQQFIDVTDQLNQDVIPQLSQALTLTKAAYERGRLKYQDWNLAQQELLSARKQLIKASSAALINQALIEKLTAEPLPRQALNSLN